MFGVVWPATGSSFTLYWRYRTSGSDSKKLIQQALVGGGVPEIGGIDYFKRGIRTLLPNIARSLSGTRQRWRSSQKIDSPRY